MPSITDSKCVLVIGATSGLGKALALSILALPAQPIVIIAGRRQARLDEITEEHAASGRLEAIQMDIDADRASLKKTVEEVLAKYPKLDTVIFSAGIQRELGILKPEGINLDDFASELNTNYTAVVTMINYFLPHFVKLGSEGQPCIISPITSGLAIITAPWLPGYCASKAAMHSFCTSLSMELIGKNVSVMEIIPPLVESELHDHAGMSEQMAKFWMPLTQFMDLTMDAMKRGDVQIATGNAKIWSDKFDQGKTEIVQMMMDHHK